MQYPARYSELPEYAFPRLRRLLAGHAPGGPEIAMSLGEPQHQVPDFVGGIMLEHTAKLSKYPPNEGLSELREAASDWLARRYGVGVGKAGLEFTGTAVIQVKKEWPTWRPTNEMIEREPNTYRKFVDNDYVQPGGPGNPLGARALYLFQNGKDTYFRIHGTTAPNSIGRSVSNGCIRMLNDHVIDLYNRVPIGTVVTVLS